MYHPQKYKHIPSNRPNEEAKDSFLIDPSTPRHIPSKEAEDSYPVSPIQKNPQQETKRFFLKILHEP